jgi:hypothetical protein
MATQPFDHEKTMLPADYQAKEGDIYIQEERAERFAIYIYRDSEWTQSAALSPQEARLLVESMQFIGKTPSMRRYYRPTGQEQKHESE